MTQHLATLPIIYSLRHCPYAMRARLAIFKSQQKVWLRDIKLDNKPAEMLALSTDKTVPMLVLPATQKTTLQVIEESVDIMQWALSEQDPQHLLSSDGATLSEMLRLIDYYDRHLIPANEAYKCAKRYQESNLDACREACEVDLRALEERLTKHRFLMSDDESLLDIALMPFIRQFSKVERQWYQQSPYPKLRAWLTYYLQSPMFTKIMAKQPLWVDCHQDIAFGDFPKK